MGKAKRLRAAREAEKRHESSRYPPGARGFELKIARADEHLQDVTNLAERWADDCLKTLCEEPDPDEAGYYCAWIDAPELNLQRLSLDIGDCLQCLRSTLDHLAFELATKFTVPMTNEIEKDSTFPILSDTDKHGQFGVGPSKWQSSGRLATRGMDVLAQAEVERLQPYQRGNLFHTDPLWRLGLLNNIDKHRVLHLATRAMEGAVINVPGASHSKGWKNVAYLGRADGAPWTLRSGGDIPPKGRALVARWCAVPVDPTKPMHMEIEPVLSVLFAPGTPLVAETSVLDVIRAIRDHIVGYVLPPLVGFLK